MRKILAVLGVLSLGLFGCSPNNVNEDDSIKQYFDEQNVTGTFGQFDNTRGEFTIYNLARFADTAFLPAASFDVVNAMIALETGVITNDTNAFIHRIHFARVFAEGEENCDSMSMRVAFRSNCTPYFRYLAMDIGKDTLQFWLDSLGYGRLRGRPVINREDTFWLDNSVKVTADEQLGLIKKIYFEQLPTQKWTQRIIQAMMLVAENNQYKLAYKTGTGRTDRGTTIGWVLGWIEENKHPYPFVLQIESADPTVNVESVSLNILDKILKHYGFKEGKK
jgi:beta-lactamase class D